MRIVTVKRHRLRNLSGNLRPHLERQHRLALRGNGHRRQLRLAPAARLHSRHRNRPLGGIADDDRRRDRLARLNISKQNPTLRHDESFSESATRQHYNRQKQYNSIHHLFPMSGLLSSPNRLFSIMKSISISAALPRPRHYLHVKIQWTSKFTGVLQTYRSPGP